MRSAFVDIQLRLRLAPSRTETVQESLIILFAECVVSVTPSRISRLVVSAITAMFSAAENCAVSARYDFSTRTRAH